MRPALRLTWVELKLFVREPLTAVFTFAFPLVMLFVLAEVFGNSVATDDDGSLVYRGVGPIDFYVPAYVALVSAAVGLVSLPVHLAGYRERGVLRRFRASGMPMTTLLAAEVAVSLVIVAVSGLVIGGSAAAVYRVAAPEHVLGVAVTFLLVALSFAAIGVLLGALLPNARAAQGAGIMLFFVMLMICGAGPPPEVLSGPLRAVADLLPLTYGVRLIQDPWLGLGWDWTATAVMLVVLVVGGAVAVPLLRRR